MPRWFSIFAALLLLPAAARAKPGDELTISVMTMEAGDAIYEKFAHNTLRVQDASTGDDIAYNWGLFDFEEKHFYVNFLLGKLNYWMEGWPGEATARAYAADNRSVWVQELNLAPQQKVKLRDFLRWNALPENRTYAYNYYTDNCSTRVRDAVDSVLDGQIRRQLEAKQAGATFRWHTRRLTRDNVFWYTALNTVLGPATDRPINAWEEGFLPIKLMEHLRTVTMRDAEGREIPLVKSERQIFKSTRPPEASAPPNWIVPYFVVGALLGTGVAASGHLATRGRAGRTAFAVIITAVATLIGFCGALGLWAWLGTAHSAAWRNENLLGYKPLALVLAFFVPRLIRRPRRAAKVAIVLSLVIVASTLIGILASPLLPQVNGEPMAFILPVNVGLAYAIWRYAKTGSNLATKRRSARDDLTRPAGRSDKEAS